MDFILKNKNNTVILLIWLLIYLSISPIHLFDYVLCISADGHIELEIGVNGRCTHPHDSHEDHTEVLITSAAMEEHHSGSCIDLAIFVSLNTYPYLVPPQDSPPLIFALAAGRTIDQTSHSTILPPSPLLEIPSVINPTLIYLRSTTLLI